MEEEKNKEKENSTQPSEKENQDQPEKEKSENPDYKAEFKEMEKRIMDGFNKKLSEIHYKIRQAAKGELPEEEETALNQEQIRGIVAEVVKEETGKIGEQFNNQISEITKSFASNLNKSKGGGEGGQKLPKEEGTPRPKLSDDEEKTVEGMTWDSKRAGWVDLSTKQFYPHKRETTSKE